MAYFMFWKKKCDFQSWLLAEYTQNEESLENLIFFLASKKAHFLYAIAMHQDTAY